MNDTALTVVLAAKDPDERQMARCLASFAALACAPRLQILLVQSGTVTLPSTALASAFASFTTVETPPRGVYAAYNVGIDHSLEIGVVLPVVIRADDLPEAVVERQSRVGQRIRDRRRERGTESANDHGFRDRAAHDDARDHHAIPGVDKATGRDVEQLRRI